MGLRSLNVAASAMRATFFHGRMNMISPKENIIYEDADAIVVLSLDPISQGHVVVKPKKKYKDIDDLPEDLLNKILKLTQCYVRVLKKEYSPKGYSIMQNGGEFNDAAQFHLHVFPRNSKEEFSWTYSDHVDSSATDFREIKKQLQGEFQKLLQ